MISHMREKFRRHGKYFYRIADLQIKKPYTRKSCAACGKSKMMQVRATARFCSKRCMQLGENNTVWKGDAAGYLSKHQRQYRLLGKAGHCVFGCTADRYEWANLNADNDDAGGWGFASMCVSCHRSYDHAVAKCFDKTCQRGHILTQATMYVKTRKGREVRQCKECAKDRAKGLI